MMAEAKAACFPKTVPLSATEHHSNSLQQLVYRTKMGTRFVEIFISLSVFFFSSKTKQVGIASSKSTTS